MTDHDPLVSPIKGGAKEGVERLLLAPVYLIYEIVAVLLPGVLFIILLLAKGNHSVISAFQNPILGYKTKICIAIVLAYLAGKVFSGPADGLRVHFTEKFTKEAQNPNSKTTHDLAKKFLIGVYFLPGLYASEHALDYLVMMMMNVSFSVTTGIVLLISACIPGDHSFRWVELAVGVLLLIRGYRGYRVSLEFSVYMLGVTLSSEIQKLAPGVAPMQTAAALFARLAAMQSTSQEAPRIDPSVPATSETQTSLPAPAEGPQKS
jgi:hypothetical protein